MASSPSIVVRPPAVAGSLYPAQTAQLAECVAKLVAAAAHADPRFGWPKALIVPHAGLAYSGSVAAAAFAEWRRGVREIRRVILVGPAHRSRVAGIALPAADAFDTPLGQVPVDRLAEVQLADLPFVTQSAKAHAWEYSLEMQLPFLQHVLQSFSVVPLAVGRATPAQVAEVILRLWDGPETVIALSTDLSHTHARADVEALDAHTVERILALRNDIHDDEACGATALNGLLIAAQQRRLAIRRVAQGTSADLMGDGQRVVGYGAFALEDLDVTGAAPGKHLLALARQAIAHRLGLAPQPHPARWWLQAVGATFVTLKLHGAERGCVGTLDARWPLGEDLLANAVHAAFDDPRFAPLERSDWPAISLEVQLLSAPEPLIFASDADLLRQLQPHVDGVILEHAGQRGACLPQMWSGLADKRRFLTRLRRSAGLPPGAPLEACRLWRCRVARFAEPETYA